MKYFPDNLSVSPQYCDPVTVRSVSLATSLHTNVKQLISTLLPSPTHSCPGATIIDMFDPMIESYSGLCLGHSVSHSVCQSLCPQFFYQTKGKTSLSAQCVAV